MVEQEYGIQKKHASSENPQAKATIEKIHQVLGNLVHSYHLQETYTDYADPWMGILASEAFVVKRTYHRTKGKSLVQLLFGQDMMLPINHIENWRYIRHRKQEQ